MGNLSSRDTKSRKGSYSLPTQQTYFMTFFGRPDHIDSVVNSTRFKEEKPKQIDAFGHFLISPMFRRIFSSGFHSNQDLLDTINNNQHKSQLYNRSYRPSRFDLPTDDIPLELLVKEDNLTQQPPLIPSHLPFIFVSCEQYNRSDGQLTWVHGNQYQTQPSSTLQPTQEIEPYGFFPYSTPTRPIFSSSPRPYEKPGSDGVHTEKELFQHLRHSVQCAIRIKPIAFYNFHELMEGLTYSPHPPIHLGSIIILNLAAYSSLQCFNQFIRMTQTLLNKGCVFPLLQNKVTIYMINAHFNDQLYITPTTITETLNHCGFHHYDLINAELNPSYLIYDEYEHDDYGKYRLERQNDQVLGYNQAQGHKVPLNNFFRTKETPQDPAINWWKNLRSELYAHPELIKHQSKSEPIFLPSTFDHIIDNIRTTVLKFHLKMDHQGCFEKNLMIMDRHNNIVDKPLPFSLFQAFSLYSPQYSPIKSHTFSRLEPIPIRELAKVFDNNGKGGNNVKVIPFMNTRDENLFKSIASSLKKLPCTYNTIIFLRSLYYVALWLQSPNFLIWDDDYSAYPPSNWLYQHDPNHSPSAINNNSKAIVTKNSHIYRDYDDLSSYYSKFHALTHITNPEPLHFATEFRVYQTELSEQYIQPYRFLIQTRDVVPSSRIYVPKTLKTPLFVNDQAKDVTNVDKNDKNDTNLALASSSDHNTTFNHSDSFHVNENAQSSPIITIRGECDDKPVVLPYKYEFDAVHIFDCIPKISDPSYALTSKWLFPLNNSTIVKNFNKLMERRLGGGQRRLVQNDIRHQQQEMLSTSTTSSSSPSPSPNFPSQYTHKDILSLLYRSFPQGYYPQHIMDNMGPLEEKTYPSKLLKEAFKRSRPICNITLPNEELPDYLRSMRPDVERIVFNHSRARFTHQFPISPIHNSTPASSLSPLSNQNNQNNQNNQDNQTNQNKNKNVEINMTYHALQSQHQMLWKAIPELSTEAHPTGSESALKNGIVYSPLGYTYCLIAIPFIYIDPSDNPAFDVNVTKDTVGHTSHPPPIPSLLHSPSSVENPCKKSPYHQAPPDVLYQASLDSFDQYRLSIPSPNCSYNCGNSPYALEIPSPGMFLEGIPSLAHLECPIYFCVVLLNDVICDVNPKTNDTNKNVSGDHFIQSITESKYRYFKENVPIAYFNQLTRQIYTPLTTGCPVEKFQKLIKVDFVKLNQYEEYFDNIERDSIDIRLQMYYEQARRNSKEQSFQFL